MGSANGILDHEFKVRPGASLVDQWLRLCAPTEEGTGSISGWGTKIPHVAWRGKKNKKQKQSKTSQYGFVFKATLSCLHGVQSRVDLIKLRICQ